MAVRTFLLDFDAHAQMGRSLLRPYKGQG